GHDAPGVLRHLFEGQRMARAVRHAETGHVARVIADTVVARRPGRHPEVLEVGREAFAAKRHVEGMRSGLWNGNGEGHAAGRGGGREPSERAEAGRPQLQGAESSTAIDAVKPTAVLSMLAHQNRVTPHRLHGDGSVYPRQACRHPPGYGERAGTARRYQ